MAGMQEGKGETGMHGSGDKRLGEEAKGSKEGASRGVRRVRNTMTGRGSGNSGVWRWFSGGERMYTRVHAGGGGGGAADRPSWHVTRCSCELQAL